MTTLELALVAVLATAGFISVCVLLLLLAASIAQREVDEARFRRQLREAINEDEHESCATVRGHSRGHLESVASRRGER